MTTGRGRRWALRVAVPVLAAIALLGIAPPAWSHSEIDRSDPPNGGMIAPGRTSLRLWYAEPVSASASTFVLVAANGRHLDVAYTVDRDARAVRLETAPLALGLYELQWQAFSLEDGHTSGGTLAFGVGVRPPVVPDAGSGLPPLPLTVLRWVDLGALLAAVGALAVSGRVLGGLGELGSRPRRKARRIALLAVILTAYSALVTPFVRTYAGGLPDTTWLGETWDVLRQTSWGHLWLSRVLATLLAAAAVWWWARHDGRSPLLVRCALLALAAASLLESLAGHASTLPRLSAVAAVVGATHVMAAGVWAGGVGVLAVCLLPVIRRRPDLSGVVLSSTWRHFSPMAAVSSLVLLATGLYEAGRHVPRVAALADTVYGGAVAGKTVLLAVALTMGGLNLLVVNPGASARAAHLLRRPAGWTPVPRRHFTRIVTAEALVLLAAVGLAAVLTTSPTAREAEDAARPSAPRTATAEGLYVTFENASTGPGRNLLVARVRSTVRPSPAPVLGVDVELTGVGSVRLVRVAEGRFEGTASTSAPGTLPATLRIHRGGRPDVVIPSAITVTPVPGSQVTRLEVLATLAGLGLLIGVLVGLAFYRLRRRREVVREGLAEMVVEKTEVSVP